MSQTETETINETDFIISKDNEEDIYHNNKKINQSEDSITDVVDNLKKQEVLLLDGVSKQKNIELNSVSYLVSAKGQLLGNWIVKSLLLLGLGLSIYFGLIIVLQFYFVVFIILLKKIYDEKHQKITIEPGKLTFKKNYNVELKKIKSVLVADLRKKEIVAEKVLSYHWHVENLILEDIGNANVNTKSILEVDAQEKLGYKIEDKGRYSILVSVEDKDLEILRGLSKKQVNLLMKELTD